MKKILSAMFLSGALAVSVAAADYQHNHQHASSPQTVTKSDGSMVEVRMSADGTKTEMRTFKTGDIARVTRTTLPTGERMVIVEYRDGHAMKLEDDSDIEQAMDATADAVKSFASTAWNETKEVGREVADKTEDVADVTVDKTKEVGKEVADKSEDVVDKTVDMSKKAGKVAVKGVKVTAEKAEDVADKTVDISKEVGKEVADKSEDVVDKTVETGKKSGNWMKRGFRKVGGWFKNMFD